MTETSSPFFSYDGVVKSVSRLFDELLKCDEEGILAEVRKAAEGAED